VTPLPPETEVLLGAVTKWHDRVVSPANRHVLMPDYIGTDGGGFTDPNIFVENLSVKPAEIDHFVVLSRKRENVTFEDFAETPNMDIPAEVTEAEVAGAAKRLDEVKAERRVFDRNLQWAARSADLAALDALSRDPTTPSGAMRILMDKLLAGDAAGVREYLTGDPQRVAAVADRMAGYGRVFSDYRQRFGIETLSVGTVTVDEFHFVQHMPAESLIGETWSIQEETATNRRPHEVLVRQDNRWRLDVDQLGATDDVWANYPKNTENDQQRWKTTLADLDAGKVSAESAMGFLGNYNNWKP
jgi:hypothetical protein